jgi:hypothetical protein
MNSIRERRRRPKKKQLKRLMLPKLSFQRALRTIRLKQVTTTGKMGKRSPMRRHR